MRSLRSVMSDWLLAWREPREAESLGDGLVRLRDPLYARFHRAPFPGYVTQPGALGPAPRPWPAAVAFASRDGTTFARITPPAGADLYGTGEVAGPLRRNGLTITCWNHDAYGYDDATPHLYQSHPWVLAVAPDGSALGVLAETTHRCEIDLTRGIQFRVDGPSAPILLIQRDSVEAVLGELARLTGHMPLPPRWALGYHQCRFSYFPAARVREIASEFRRRRIPCDAIWMDIDYMRGFRSFTFDPDRFPDPANLNADLQADGFRTVWMIDPGIKVDDDSPVYVEGRNGDHFLHDAAGREAQGKVWPGLCAFPDFTRQATRTWWAGLYADFLATGIGGVWNDMNEPAVFDVPSKTLPLDTHHRADDDLGGPGPHARYHNLYGMQMVRASREGMLAVHPDRRPFLLTRANLIGGQRYAATWTGDNTSDWRHLRWSIPMAINLGLSGQPFVGPDIGGFAGNASPELFARWMGIGALLPFARAHTCTNTVDHEPWSFGPECERICRLAIERRMRLLPYLYTCFEAASRTGVPVVRPAFFLDPANPSLRSVDDAFLLGPDVYVRCCVDPQGRRWAPAPPPGWLPFEPVEAHPDLPQLFLRPGAILPLGPVMQHSGEKPLDPLTLLINFDASDHARGTLYEDSGDGFAFTRGDFTRTAFTARRADPEAHISTNVEGQRKRVARTFTLEVLSRSNA